MGIIRDRRVSGNRWRHVPEGADGIAAARGAVTVALADWRLHRDALRVRKAPVGVRLAPDQELDDIVADLRSLAVVVFEFPSFTEGRPYSRARLLRGRHGYGGEIRALGDVARDRLAFMERCGFNAFELRGGQSAPASLAAFGEITHVYQSTARRTAA